MRAKRIAILPSAPPEIGAWPGLVSVRLATGRVVWLDLDGKLAKEPALPLAPSRARFLDDKRGLAVFPASGVAYTRDGGATWSSLDVRPSTDFDADDGVLRFQEWEIDARGAKVLLGVRTDGKTACLEGVTARLNSHGFARVDFVKNRAEGRPYTGATHELTCKLGG